MITKEEAKVKLKKLVDNFSENPKYWDSKPEEDIKHLFIEPLFEEILGWDRKDVSKEPRVLKGRADYILRDGNKEVLVIEAKKTNVSLNEEEGRQAVSYAYHRKIKFAVLTNFKDLRVYHALSNIKRIDGNLLKKDGAYFRLNFSEFLEKFDLLWLLSKESFEKKEINKLLSTKDEKVNKPIDENILADLLNIRDSLSKEIKSKKNYLSQETIDEIVQIFIDRLIFIRSVEDRGLEPMNYLRSLESDVAQQRVKLQLFPYLLEKFEEFNKKYDSKLFEKGLLEKEGTFSDVVLRKVILTLYFGSEGNQERYLFDSIPGDLFGSIYEQYLGTILAGTEKRVKLDSKSGKRKKMGIYYTPSYIVEYIVKNTVGDSIKAKSIDEILKVKIVDPACGSGSFLIKAFSEVCDKVEELLKEKKFSEKSLAFKSYKDRLNISQKATILTNCIYGVDLDEKAVELARLNLLLKLLEGEGQDTKIPKLPELVNIKCGNSLIEESKLSDRAFNWDAQFKDVFIQGGFDVVVGNPPYVDIKQLDPLIVKYLFEKYNTVENRMNLYSTFMEKSFHLLNKDGFFGFIIPNSILYNESYNKLRKLLFEESSLKNIVKLPDDTFGDAKVETIILVYQKKINKQNICEVLVYPRNTKTFQINSESAQISHVLQGNWEKQKIINLSTNESSDHIFQKIERNSKPLLDICDFSLGLTPYDKYKGHTKKQIDERVFHSTKKRDNTFQPLLSGSNIVRYGVFWDGKEYISYGEWLGAPRQKKFFTESRIIIRQILSGNPIRIYAGYTEEEFYNAQIGFNLVVKDKETSLKVILAILNSNLITFYHREKFLDKEKNLFQKILIVNAKKFPIRLPTPIQEKRIISLVNQMLELQKKYHDEKTAGHEKERLKQQIDNTDYEIDQEVYKLYEITPEEQKIIEESLK